MKTALLTSYEKDEPLLQLGKLLAAHEWNLLGSAGTAAYLSENGIQCRDIGELIGAPILGHRVVTLSREIYAGLLAATPDDFKELERLNIAIIDLVYVILYPLEESISANELPENVLEKTDIGGPTLLRAAAKGRRLALSKPEQIKDFERWLSDGAPESDLPTLKMKFAAEAERRVANYVSASATYWGKQAE